MRSVKSLSNTSPKTWFSIILVGLLFFSIVLTQFATRQTRDDRSQAASCGAGQSVIALRPTGNFSTGFFAQYPNGGSHFDKVDEAGGGDGDSTTVIDDTVGVSGGGSSVILFNHQSFDWSNKTIYTVYVSANVKEGLHSTALMDFALHNGSSLIMTAAYGADVDYRINTHSWSTSPFTGGAWSGNEVNNVKIGVNSVRKAQANPLTMTQIWMDVCYTVNPPPPPPIVVTPPLPAKPPVKPPGGGSKPPTSAPPTTVTSATTDISLNFATQPFLKGSMETQISIEGNSTTQKIVLDNKGGTFVLKPTGLTKGTTYKLKAISRNSLSASVSFVYADILTLSLAEIVTGDFNQDNQINNIDLDLILKTGFDSQESLYDVNYDGVVNSIDFAIVLINLGKTGS